ncbi:Rv3654c family TadE-like protein [Arthrobacter sp. LAPM80]|uniref:Rv3654c family TadE-like protein n=1 Tax=Arthrobacter sp. LAPM80 TaxID=3141788 RepID=UPI00398A960B
MSLFRGEEGAGTVLAAGLAFAMVLLTVLALGVGQAAVAASRAATAADLAALAAADAYRGLVPGNPCHIAGEVSARHGASLVECTLAGDQSVQVEVTVKMALPWPSTGRARAGPPPDTVLPGVR